MDSCTLEHNDSTDFENFVTLHGSIMGMEECFDGSNSGLNIIKELGRHAGLNTLESETLNESTNVTICIRGSPSQRKRKNR